MAVILRSTAEEMHFAESRAQLMALASNFEVLADCVEDWCYPVVEDGASDAS